MGWTERIVACQVFYHDSLELCKTTADIYLQQVADISEVAHQAS